MMAARVRLDAGEAYGCSTGCSRRQRRWCTEGTSTTKTSSPCGQSGSLRSTELARGDQGTLLPIHGTLQEGHLSRKLHVRR